MSVLRTLASAVAAGAPPGVSESAEPRAGESAADAVLELSSRRRSPRALCGRRVSPYHRPVPLRPLPRAARRERRRRFGPLERQPITTRPRTSVDLFKWRSSTEMGGPRRRRVRDCDPTWSGSTSAASTPNFRRTARHRPSTKPATGDRMRLYTAQRVGGPSRHRTRRDSGPLRCLANVRRTHLFARRRLC